MAWKCLAALVILRFQNSLATVSRGSTIVPGNSTVFLAKFCFTFDPTDTSADPYSDPNRTPPGWLDIDITAPGLESGSNVHVVLYDDEAHSYPGPSGQWDALSCEDRLRHAKNRYHLHTTRTQLEVVIREKLRPRYWYVAIADCSGTGVTIDYHIHARNLFYQSKQELSSDKHLMPEALTVLILVYVLLAAAQIRANAVLAETASSDSASSKAAHPFARILALGILLQLAAHVFSAIHFGRYMYDGHGLLLVHITSKLCAMSSNFILISLLLLVSQGKCVSYIMAINDVRRMGFLLVPFLVSCFLLELWGDFSTSQRYRTDYIYTTAFGWAIVSVDLLLLCLYARNLTKTLEAEGQRADGRFYLSWGIAYASWFLALPIAALLAQTVLAPYVSEIVSFIVTQTVSALVFASLVISLWPENRDTYFKHIKDFIDDVELPRFLYDTGFNGKVTPTRGLPNLLVNLYSVNQSLTFKPWAKRSLHSG